jgi:hypothetical protein
MFVTSTCGPSEEKYTYLGFVKGILRHRRACVLGHDNASGDGKGDKDRECESYVQSLNECREINDWKSLSTKGGCFWVAVVIIPVFVHLSYTAETVHGSCLLTYPHRLSQMDCKGVLSARRRQPHLPFLRDSFICTVLIPSKDNPISLALQFQVGRPTVVARVHV